MKKCYIISFDLKNPGINQQKLIAEIKTSTWARISPTSYLIISLKNSTQIRDILLAHLKQEDKIYVGNMSNSAAWFGLEEDVSIWIRNNQK
jgi:hypothetical protein